LDLVEYESDAVTLLFADVTNMAEIFAWVLRRFRQMRGTIRVYNVDRPRMESIPGLE